MGDKNSKEAFYYARSSMSIILAQCTLEWSSVAFVAVTLSSFLFCGNLLPDQYDQSTDAETRGGYHMKLSTAISSFQTLLNYTIGSFLSINSVTALYQSRDLPASGAGRDMGEHWK